METFGTHLWIDLVAPNSRIRMPYFSAVIAPLTSLFNSQWLGVLKHVGMTCWSPQPWYAMPVHTQRKHTHTHEYGYGSIPPIHPTDYIQYHISTASMVFLDPGLPKPQPIHANPCVAHPCNPNYSTSTDDRALIHAYTRANKHW